MLFRRRHKPSFWQQLRSWLWPRSGWRRTGLYVWHRLARLPGTPHSIAIGFASGVAVSFTPFLGLHILIAMAVTAIFRGSFIAAVIGTVVGNPWTFPIFFALTNHVGGLILGSESRVIVPVWNWDALYSAPFDYMADFLPVVFPLVVGGIPIAIVVWIVSYLVFKGVLTKYRTAKVLQNQQDAADEDDSNEHA